MAEFFTNFFSYHFLNRALLVGILVSLCAALLGVSLVLKRYSMIGDGLSHVSFGALSIAVAMNWAPLPVSIPVVMAAAFLLLRLSENSKIKGDAAIALISSSSLAIGVIVTSLTSGMNADVFNYMFGSILAVSQSDVWISVILFVIVLILYVVLYNKIFAVTFDESFAKATGTKVGLYNIHFGVFDRHYHCNWYAVDGCPANLQLNYFPCPDIYAGMQRIQRRDHYLVHCGSGLFLYWSGIFFSVFNAGRSHGCGGESHRFAFVHHCRNLPPLQ